MSEKSSTLPYSVFTDAFLNMRPHGIGQVARLGLGDPDVIPLWFGESDLPTPDFIREAAKRALDEGKTFYSHIRGTNELRRAIVDYTKRIYDVDLDIDRVTVPGAAMLGVHAVVEAVMRDGDNAVVVTPQWPNILMAVESQGGVAKSVTLELDTAQEPARWRLDLDKLFDAVDDRTRLIFIGSPANPTGWTATEDELKAILAFARERGVAIIADEVYGRLVYDRLAAPSFLTLAEPEDPVFVINSFSKAWAMTGWRIGWLVHPAGLTESMTGLIGCNNTGATVFAQYGAVAALEHGEGFVRQMVGRCAHGRQVVRDALADHNRMRFTEPEGAFYAFVEIDGVDDSLAFCKRLLQEHKVGLAPGMAFGPGNDNRIRLCFAQDQTRLETALERLRKAL